VKFFNEGRGYGRAVNPSENFSLLLLLICYEKALKAAAMVNVLTRQGNLNGQLRQVVDKVHWCILVFDL